MAASGAVFQHPVNPEAELFPTLIFNLLEGLWNRFRYAMPEEVIRRPANGIRETID